MPRFDSDLLNYISEADIQKSVIRWIKLHPGIAPFIFHIPNEGKRSLKYGKHLKELGLRPGASDLLIAIPKHQYNGAFIELKSAKGKLSPLQQNFLNDMSYQGYFTAVCYCLDEAIDTIKWYCFC